MSQYWSDLVNKLTPYSPGEQPQLSKLIKLNTNENPYGPSPAVHAAIDEANSEALRKYPDPNASALKTTVADYYGLQTKQVFVGNSSDEVLGHAFRGLLKHDKPLLFPDITYSFYPVYCALFNIDYQQIPLQDNFSLAIDDYFISAGAIVFANPNAPTGIALARSEIKRLLEQQSNAVVLVDEAYADFSNDSAVELIEQYPNLLITQTLSKSRSLAGLRVGLALGQAPLIEALERVKNSFHPYALDSLALAGAKAAFQDKAYFQDCCRKIISTRQRFTKELEHLGFSVLPSSANFVFASHASHDAGELYKTLREHNFLVRYFDCARINNYIRISIGKDEDMDALVQCLKVVCQ